MSKKIKKIVISGQLSAIDRDNGVSRQKFDFVKQNLIGRGFEVITEVEILDSNPDLNEAQHRVLYLQAIADCDALVVTNGWEKRRGSRIDIIFASEYKIPCFTASSFVVHVNAEDGKGDYIPTISLKLKDAEVYIEKDPESNKKLYLESKTLA